MNDTYIMFCVFQNHSVFLITKEGKSKLYL